MMSGGYCMSDSDMYDGHPTPPPKPSMMPRFAMILLLILVIGLIAYLFSKR
jgi:hypothetical protein